MFRAFYRRLSRKKHKRDRDSQEEKEPDQPQTDIVSSSEDQKSGNNEVSPQTTSNPTTTAIVATADSQPALATDSQPALATDSQPALAADSGQMNMLAIRHQIAKLLIRLCEEREGDGEDILIVMELLESFDCVPVSLSLGTSSSSALDRVSEQLLGVLSEQTLIGAGIVPCNERYVCFKNVVRNYTKIYATRRFMEHLLELSPMVSDAAKELLQIPTLLRQLWSSLNKMEFFNEDTAFTAYLEARYHPQGRILTELLLSRISRVFLCIVSTTMFLEFNEQELLHILRHCYLSVNSEIEIFMSVVLWMEHNWSERGECAERLLGEVRFGLMPIWYLTTMERANYCQHFVRVVRKPVVQAMIAKGLQNATTIKKTNATTFSQAEAEGGEPKPPVLEAQLPRDWIVDNKCRYHHKCHCEFFVYPSYDVFKQYLAGLICCAPSYWHTFRPAQEVYRGDFRCCSPPQFN